MRIITAAWLTGVVLAVVSADAATFVVSTADAVDASPGDGVCETAPGEGVCTLRAAVQEANALAGPDAVTVPAGTYALTIRGCGAADDAATGGLNITGDIDVVGAGADRVTIGGLDCFVAAEGAFEVASGATATLSGLTMRSSCGLGNAGHKVVLPRVETSGSAGRRMATWRCTRATRRSSGR